MKTRKEVEGLKQGWLPDPCWDIEDTEGFENHTEELREFRKGMEAQWAARAAKREAAIDAEADQLGVQGLLRLVRELQEETTLQRQAILILTEGDLTRAWRVLTRREEP